MSKFKGVLLYSDYDDTLIGRDHKICPRNREAIESFMAQGGTFGVATGRAYSAFIKHWEDVPMNAPTVLGNGAAIYDFPREIWLRQTYLCEKIPGRLAELTKVFPEIGFEVYHGEEIYAWNPNVVTKMHLSIVGAECRVTPLEEIPQPWSKIIFEQDTPMLQEVQKYIQTHWEGDCEIIFSNRFLLECTARGSHKGAMVSWAAEQMGFSPEHIYCVGDNQNDIPMLSISSIPFAPANCAQVVKDWGARLVDDCDTGAIAHIISILDEKYS